MRRLRAGADGGGDAQTTGAIVVRQMLAGINRIWIWMRLDVVPIHADIKGQLRARLPLFGNKGGDSSSAVGPDPRRVHLEEQGLYLLWRHPRSLPR